MQALAAHDVRCAAVRGVLLQAFQPVVRFCGSGAYENCELNLMQREREEGIKGYLGHLELGMALFRYFLGHS